jgi:rhodanese-related sulfurtransferase
MRIAEAHKMPEGYAQVRPGDVARRDDLLFVDVRAEESDLLSDMGHIHGIRHVPLKKLLEDGIEGAEKDTPIVVVCNDGRESRDAAVALVRDHGFGEVYHMVGGMLRWHGEERPAARTRTFS